MPEKEILTRDNVADSHAGRMIGGQPVRLPQELNPGLCMGIVAIPNTGKTTLAGTLRESVHGLGAPAIIIDSNANAEVLPACDDLFVVKSRRGFSTAKAVVEELKAGRHEDVRSLVFDHVTNMYNDTVADGTSPDRRQNYQTAMADLINLARDCKDLAEGPRRLNVFFMFQESQEGRVIFEDGVAKAIMRQEVSLSDKMQTAWPSYIPLMGGLRIGMFVPPYPRVLDFTPSEVTMTKWQIRSGDERLARIPILVWNPSLGRILDVIVGGDPVPPEWTERPKAQLMKG